MDTLIPTWEAAKILKRSEGRTRQLIKYDEQQVMLKPGSIEPRLTNMYSLKRLLVLKAEIAEFNTRAFKQSKRAQLKQYTRKHTIKTIDDPYNVCNKITYRGRKCPLCGALVPTGTYACVDCRPKIASNHYLSDDPNAEYCVHG